MSKEIKRPAILCAGSDRRLVHAAERLSELGEVCCFGMGGTGAVRRIERLDDMERPADLLVLPVPCNTGLRIPSAAGALGCDELSAHLAEGALVTGGMLNDSLRGCFEEHGFAVEDYFTREELVLKNCIPTAEGTLELALRELPVTVNGLDVLIVGYGRVAAACARLFSAVGARVTVTARRRSALAEAECAGSLAFSLAELADRAADYRLIINTVPAMVIDEKVVGRTRGDCLIIDLASKPGGTAFDACDREGRRYIHALGLPGKCSPVTAGGIIADTVMQIYTDHVSAGQ